MANNTFIVVPQDVTDPVALTRFLSRLVELIDVAFGERADSQFVTGQDFRDAVATLSLVASESEELGAVTNAGLDERVTSLEANLDKNYIANAANTLVTASATYQQSEAQQVADDVIVLRDTIDDIIQRLKDANVITT